MTALSLLALLAAAPAWADAPVPYFNRSFGTSQSTGAVNANFLDLTQRNRDNLVNSITDNACAAGQALTGATQKGGYIFGGTCTAVASSPSVSFATNTSNSFASSGSSVVIDASFALTTGIWRVLVDTSPAGLSNNFLGITGIPTAKAYKVHLTINTTCATVTACARLTYNANYNTAAYFTPLIETNTGRGGPNVADYTGINGCNLHSWQATSGNDITFDFTILTPGVSNVRSVGGWSGANTDGLGGGPWTCIWSGSTSVGLSSMQLWFTSSFTVRNFIVEALGQ